MRLLTAAGAGNGTAVTISEWGNRYNSRIYTLFVWGTFGGSTVTLEISPDNSNWFPVAGISITAAGAVNAEFRAPYVRAVVTGGAAQAVDALLL